ncbi:hypothetical protein [Granulicella sp. dw_53]|uniref:hypothetical protein n=1 Tax=Granulicella sp. dw_53 TaxID=2719792 RepID=UPI001BD45C03|nr:hypothetical protein [Granulicella sp. dw_53]
MRFTRIHVLQSLLVLSSMPFTGCGSNPVSAPPASVSPNITGNWQIGTQNTSSVPTKTVFNLVGALSMQGSQASAVFRAPSSIFSSVSCSSMQDIGIPFAGSIDASNLLTLTSAPFSGSTATLQLQLPLTRSQASGSIQITGDSCPLASTPVLGRFIPSVTGTYTGTLAPFPGQATTTTGGTATITLTQASANADGQFPVTASLSFTSPTCTLPATPLTGAVSGAELSLNSAPPTPTDSPSIRFNAGAFFAGATLSGSSLNILSDTPGCLSGNFLGVLMSQ